MSAGMGDMGRLNSNNAPLPINEVGTICTAFPASSTWSTISVRQAAGKPAAHQVRTRIVVGVAHAQKAEKDRLQCCDHDQPC